MHNVSMIKTEKNNVIPVYFDAGFFFERGVRSFHRYDLHKAFKYFQKCIELDGKNPRYQLHLSAVLTEMGLFEQSNDLLVQLKGQHHELPECDFYMANNFVHTGKFEEAEKHILYYLENDPEGFYVDEAEEILDFICFELDRLPRPFDEEDELHIEHERARDCLEQGKFLEASHRLQEIIKDHPDYLAAYNNLALAYYFLGEFNRALAMIDNVLLREPANLHALCNLALFLNKNEHEADSREVEQLIEGLKKIYPLHIDHAYKLGTTLGILGEDQRAFEQFTVLIKRGLTDDVCLWHYLAVASYNLGYVQEAVLYWQKLQEIDPFSKVAEYYLHFIADVVGVDQQEMDRQTTQIAKRIPYHYQLPYDVKWKQKIEAQNQALPADLVNDPLIRSSLFWSLRTGDRDTKLQVIQSLQFFADQEAEQALRQFIQKEDEEDYVKKVAIFVLRQMGASSPYEAVLNHEHIQIDADWVDESCPMWQSRWQKVIQCMHKYMGDEYHLIEQQQAQAIWTKYLRACYPDLPQIRKAEAWAAAIEFLIVQNGNYTCTKAEMARKYGISVSTLTRKVYQIETAILLDVVKF